MSVKLLVGGTEYQNWTSVMVSRSIDAASSTFSFVHAADEKQFIPIRAGDPVVVLINGYTVMTGFVDSVEVGYSADQHSVQITGRDKTSDIIDSKVDYNIEFAAPITLMDVAQQTVSNLGADVLVVSEVGSISPFDKGDLLSASIGQTAFSFIENYARKRQVLITTNGKGDLVLTRSDNAPIVGEIKNRINEGDTNVLSASALRDLSDRYSEYKMYSQGNPAGDPSTSETSQQLTDRTATHTDSEVRSSRKYNNLSESSSKEASLTERVKWESAIRKAKSFSYECTVVGFGPKGLDGEPFKPNTQLVINDDFAEVYETLLITSVEFSFDLYNGSRTSLTLIPKEAYTAQDSSNDLKEKRPNRKTPKQAADEQRETRELEQLWVRKQ